mgnify:CR=1 FL=1
MVNMFGYNKAWALRADQMKLRYLADSRHALAAFIIGEALMKKGDDLAIEWLVHSHNAGHTYALLFLSGYLAQKENPLGAIACKVISADSGCEVSQLAIFHPENIDYMYQCAPNQLREVLADLSGKTAYSVARYLQSILLMAVCEDEGLSILDEVIAKPLKRPKKEDLKVWWCLGTLVKVIPSSLIAISLNLMSTFKTFNAQCVSFILQGNRPS